MALTQVQVGLGGNSNAPAFCINLSANPSIPNNVNTIIPFNVKVFDTASAFNNTGSTVGTAPPYSFNPQVAGYYQINAQCRDGSGSGSGQNNTILYKNGYAFTQCVLVASGNGTCPAISNVIYMNGSTDYLQIYYFQNSGGTEIVNSNSLYSFFSGCLLRAA